METIMKLGFTGGNVKPCLYMKSRMKGIIYIDFYVNDKLMKGISEAINKTLG